MDNSRDVCSACNAPIEPGSKFCTECGKPVENNDREPVGGEPAGEKNVQSTLNCPECNAALTAEDRFCTECGANLEGDIGADEEKAINEDMDSVTNCPKCNVTITPGTRFCTECGTNIYEYEPQESVTTVQTGNSQTEISGTGISSNRTVKSRDDPLDELKETGQDLMKDVEKTGKGLMKDLGSFLGKSSQDNSKKTIKPAKKDQSFLVCNKCGGYYELQKGESPDDFSLECECGGHLEYTRQHP